MSQGGPYVPQRYGNVANWRCEGEPLPGEAGILRTVVEEVAPEPDETPEPEEVLPKPVSVSVQEEPAQPADDQPAGAQQAEELSPESEEAPSPEPAKLALQRAYAVTVKGTTGEVEYVAVGADIGDAALKALAALREHGTEGTVVGIQFLTQALT